MERGEGVTLSGTLKESAWTIHEIFIELPRISKTLSRQQKKNYKNDFTQNRKIGLIRCAVSSLHILMWEYMLTDANMLYIHTHTFGDTNPVWELQNFLMIFTRQSTREDRKTNLSHVCKSIWDPVKLRLQPKKLLDPVYKTFLKSVYGCIVL